MMGRLRVSLSLGVGLLLVAAPAAWAQGGSPIGGCKTFSLGYTGASGGDAKAGSISGGVQLECDGTWIFAELITWDEKIIHASGDVLVVQPGLRVNAERMEMDRQTKYGTFFEAYGTATVTDQEPDKNMFGGQEPEIMFRASKIERIGPRTYRLTDGAFSTCVQPTPRWEMTGSTGTVTLDDKVVMKNMQLRVKHIPVLYLPYIYYPMKHDDRATGILIPVYSASGVKGQGLSNAFFWAIDRSQDATFNYDWFSKGGQGAGADYRYVATAGSGNGSFYTFDQNERLASDGSVELQAKRSFRYAGQMNQTLGRFTMIGNLHYNTDQISQLLYEQNIYTQSRRDRQINVSASGYVFDRRLRIAALADRKDIFNGATAATYTRLPQVDARFTKREPLLWKVSFGAAGQATYLDVRPDPAQPQYDRSLWRFDGITSIQTPLSSLPYLPVSASASWQVTNWTESLDPLTGLPVPTALTRNLFDLRVNASGPVIERVFDTPKSGYAERFKHVIEPQVGVQYLSPFDMGAQVVKIDNVDRLVGGTTTVTYGLVNRIVAKVRTAGGGTTNRPFATIRINQSFYSDAQAGAIDPNYSNGSVGTYSPISLVAAFNPIEDIDGTFQMSVDATTRQIRSYSVGARIWRPKLQLDGSWSKRRYLPNVPGFNNPASASHYLGANATVRLLDGRLGATYGFQYNLQQNGFLQQRIAGYYASQCCGISVDYQMMNISQFRLEGVPRDRRLAITFSLAGIGSFATPLGAFGR